MSTPEHPRRSVEFFHQVYAGSPAWEIDAPQPVIIRLQEAGLIQGMSST